MTFQLSSQAQLEGRGEPCRGRGRVALGHQSIQTGSTPWNTDVGEQIPFQQIFTNQVHWGNLRHQPCLLHVTVLPEVASP